MYVLPVIKVPDIEKNMYILGTDFYLKKLLIIETLYGIVYLQLLPHTDVFNLQGHACETATLFLKIVKQIIKR